MIPSSGPTRIVFFVASILAVVGLVISAVLLWTTLRSDHRQNLLAKALFWPITGTLLFAVTAWIFY